MKLRKTRIPQQGIVSNQFPLTYQSLCQTTSNHPQLIHPLKQTSLGKEKLPLVQQSNQRHHHSLKPNKKLQPLNPNTKKIVDKLRLQYKSKVNVRKIIRNWNIHHKGRLSPEEFQANLKNYFKTIASKQECEEILKHYTLHQSKSLDTQGFLNMIFYEPSDMAVTHNLYDPSNQKLKRETNIDNLIEKVDDYHQEKPHKQLYQMNDHEINDFVKRAKNASYLQKLKRTSKCQNLRMSESEKNILKSTIDSINYGKDGDQIERQIYKEVIKGKPIYRTSKNQSQVTSDKNFFSKVHLQKFQTRGNLSKLSDEFKRTNMNSIILPNEGSFQSISLGKGKTRFNGNPFVKKIIFGNDSNEFATNKSHEIIQDERNMEKIRYQNKLNKIREYQKIQKENINKIDEKYDSIDKGNILKRKMEQEAYNYATFIQNKWQ